MKQSLDTDDQRTERDSEQNSGINNSLEFLEQLVPDHDVVQGYNYPSAWFYSTSLRSTTGKEKK